MAQEAFCPTHGPYPASYGACPYCSGKAGGGSSNVDETRIYAGSGAAGPDIDEMPTEFPSRLGRPDSSEEVTQFPARRRTGPFGESTEDETIVEHRLEGMLGWLIVKRGDRRGQIFRIGNEYTIGRGKGASIVLSDGKVSKLHAKIGVREGRFVILDVMSENGTYVNTQRIQGETPLAENDEIQMGDTVMVLKVLPAEQE